jgi:hypothetical protein
VTIQCAWCLRIQDAAGTYTIEAAVMHRGANMSHGICEPCSTTLMAANAAGKAN